MKLCLVRHGGAGPDEVDRERPLSEKGRRDVARLAEALAGRGLGAQRAYHSGRRRARETAEALEGSLVAAGAISARPGLDPNDPVEPLVTEIAAWSEDTVVVGHLPFLGLLLERLVSESGDGDGIRFHAGTAVCLERGGAGAQKGAWSILWAEHPE